MWRVSIVDPYRFQRGVPFRLHLRVVGEPRAMNVAPRLRGSFVRYTGWHARLQMAFGGAMWTSQRLDNDEPQFLLRDNVSGLAIHWD